MAGSAASGTIAPARPREKEMQCVAEGDCGLAVGGVGWYWIPWDI